MRIKVIKHYNKLTGDFLGYEIQYKPFWWWPGWRNFDGLPWLQSRREMEHDVFFVLSIEDIIRTEDKFD